MQTRQPAPPVPRGRSQGTCPSRCHRRSNMSLFGSILTERLNVISVARRYVPPIQLLAQHLTATYHPQIWLKDAVQCIACQMCCHKKCINKCQNATVCGSATDPACSTPLGSNNPEFKVTDTGDMNANTSSDVFADELLDTKSGDGHRASLGDFIAQGLKRVNSANNLAIPAIVATLSNSQGTKSLPPSPQLTPRWVTINRLTRLLTIRSPPGNNRWLILQPVHS